MTEAKVAHGHRAVTSLHSKKAPSGHFGTIWAPVSAKLLTTVVSGVERPSGAQGLPASYGIWIHLFEEVSSMDPESVVNDVAR